MSRKVRIKKFFREFESEWSQHYWSFISRHLDKDLNWKRLSKCSYITQEIIENNLDLPWSIYWMSLNPNMTLKFVKKYSNWGWNWNFLSSVIPMKEILSNLDLPWSFMLMSRNNGLTMDIIESFPDKNWDWSSISLLPLVNMDVLNKYPKKIWNLV